MIVRAIRPFWIGAYPVFTGQYLKVADAIGLIYVNSGYAVESQVKHDHAGAHVRPTKRTSHAGTGS